MHPDHKTPTCICPTGDDEPTYSLACPDHAKEAQQARICDFVMGVESDFWKRLRATFPEAAANEGPPNTWKDNPRYKLGTHAGARIRNAAEAMMKDWLAVYSDE